jgi:hypothetical protein
MGNSLLEKIKIAECCCNQNLKKVITFRLDEDKTSKNSELPISIGGDIKINLLDKSSLRDVEIQMGQSQNIFSNNSFHISDLNHDYPEDINISENKNSYDYFFLKIFDEINKLRTDPLNYSKLFIKYSNEIQKDLLNRNYFLYNGEKLYIKFNKEDFLLISKDLEKFDEKLKNKKTSLKKLI